MRQLKQEQLLKLKKECEKGNHKWSNWFCVPYGLAKECCICSKIEILTSDELKEIFNAKTTGKKL